MLDIKYIRDHVDLIKQAATDKHVRCDVDRLVVVDADRRRVRQELDALRTKSREGGETIGQLRNPKSKLRKEAAEAGRSDADIETEVDGLQSELNKIKTLIKPLEEQDRQVVEEFDTLMWTIPQPPAPEVPVGKDDTENVEIRRVGTVPQFNFELKDHVDLGERLGILDIERGVKLSGSRNYTLKGAGALMYQAVLRLAMDRMIDRGFTPMHVPVLVREEVMYGTGYFPTGRDQAYLCERDEMSLVGTAEVPLTAFHSGEILSEDDLPIKMVAVSPCFRREAGAAGKDTRGLYRIHLFDKVEQVIICKNDEETSKQFHEEIVANAEGLLQELELPYRVVNVCTGDLGQGQVQKFDIETWIHATVMAKRIRHRGSTNFRRDDSSCVTKGRIARRGIVIRSTTR